ncbi:unnamed protein product [Orchesella dallaii]|uniref:DDB1-and CUL4-associated factor 17 n=1 Tax=Orchesella dallaii TaxID=48710 RepID=A0ABP1RF84_9HEXA
MTLRSTLPTKANYRNSWIEVKLERRYCKLRFEGGVFWENEGRTQLGRPRANTDRFFTLHDDGFKLDAECYCPMSGILTKTLVFYENYYLPEVGRRMSTSSKSSHLVMLMETGWVRMYDLSHRRNYCQLRLRGRLLEKVRFTDIACDDSTDDIFVAATFNGKVKSIYCLNYRDGAISLKSIINIGFQAAITLRSGRMIVLRHLKRNDLSSLDLLIGSNFDNDNGEGAYPSGFLQSVEVSHVSEKPITLERVPMQDFDFGSEVWEPHVFGKRAEHQLVRTEILQLKNLNTLWERSNSCFSVTNLDSFPDDSPRFLYSEGENYEVISLKRNPGDSIVAESSQPFDIPKECIESEATSAVRSERARHTRSCKTKPESESTEVFAMTHCAELELIAVCLRKHRDDTHIYIGLYEAKNLQLVKMLPPLLAWPGRQGRERTIEVGRDTMVELDLSFTMELIVVIINYAGSDKHDVFFMQLL